MVECELARIIIDEHRDEQVIFLREMGGKRAFPILIGIFEATQIDRILKERRARRPLTHDLLLDAVKALGGKLAAVRIEEFRDEIFFAKLAIAREGGEVAVDARPSDAVALALMAGAPIYVAESVLAQNAPPE
jgi:bifunctional DNase/RNase